MVIRSKFIRRKLSSIEIKKRNLRYTTDNLDMWFDDAVNPRILEIGEGIKSIEQKIHDMTESLTGEIVNKYGEPSDEDLEYGRPCDHDLDIYEDLGGLDYDLQILKEQQLSIVSMRLVYLYKSFEILLKDIVSEAFPDANKRELFQWENVKSFLNSKGIKIGEVKEYQRLNEIRVVNNNIKHSNIIDEITKKQNIDEFFGKDDFDSGSMNTFYLRIREKPKIFLADLAEKTISCLYEYDDERINKIANDFKDRMDNVSGKKLITALNKIYT